MVPLIATTSPVAEPPGVSATPPVILNDHGPTSHGASGGVVVVDVSAGEKGNITPSPTVEFVEDTQLEVSK